MRRLTKIGGVVVVLAIILGAQACAPMYSQSAYEGGAAGMAVGATAGALLDRDNAWRGGIIGGTLGAIMGASLAEIGDQAARQAAAQQQQVAYQNMAGTTRVVVSPLPYYHAPTYYTGPDTHCVHCERVYRAPCRYVTQEVWRNGELVRTIRRQVCM